MLKSMGLVAGLTLVANLLGFVREVFFARAFGATAAADAYVTAASIVATCFLLFAAGSLQGAFMPRYQNLLVERQDARARGLWRGTLILLAMVLAGLSLLLALGADFWIALIVPGFDPAQRAATAGLLIWMAPMVLFAGLGCLFQSVLHAHHRFLEPALVAPLNNIVLILALLFVVPFSGVTGFAQATLAGAGLWLLLWPFVARLLPRTAAQMEGEDFKGLLLTMAPLLVLLAADQSSALVQKALVSDLEQGSIAILNYAARLEGLPVGIFAAAVASVFFPSLVQVLSSKDAVQISQRFQLGLSAVFFCSIPAAVFLILEAPLVVKVLLERGAFDAAASARTAEALFWYSLGLVPQSLIVYLNKVYFAAGNTRTPMKVGVISAALHVVLCWGLVANFGFLGVAMGTTAYALLYMLMLVIWLPRPMAFALASWAASCWRPVLGGVLSGLVYWTVPFQPSPLGLLMAIAAGGTLYLAVAWICRDPVLRSFQKQPAS